MTFHALISPRGCVEYNAAFVLGMAAVQRLEHGRWYTNEELELVAGRCLFLRSSANAVEKNVQKWRYERQEP